MSATVQQWKALIDLVMQHIYEMDDTYMGMEYEGEADELIKTRIQSWTITELDHFIAQEFTPADLQHTAIHCAGCATCACHD